MPEIVQEIGAATGLAAVIGLAVLSALYFSQARDVRRLREWAGRASNGGPSSSRWPQPQPQLQPKTGAIQPILGRATPAARLAASVRGRRAPRRRHRGGAGGKQAPVPAAPPASLARAAWWPARGGTGL